MILLSCITVFLVFLAFAPVVVALLSRYDGSLVERLDKITSEYDGILISLGTLFLVSFLAYLTTRVSNLSSERREASNRRVQTELRVAEFRQNWIIEMRNDIAEFLRLSHNLTNESDVSRAYELSMKIEMRLNTSEDLAKSVSACLQEVSRNDLSSDELNLELSKLVITSKTYLKNEWRRLKDDLNKARLPEDVSQ